MMEMSFKKLRVKAPEGRHITGYGSRKQGEEFELLEAMANQILRSQPGAFEEVKTSRKKAERED